MQTITHECQDCGNKATAQCDTCDKHICDGQTVTHWKPGFRASKTICFDCAAEIPSFASAAVLFGIADLENFNCAELDEEATSMAVLERVAKFDRHFAAFLETEGAAADAFFELPVQSICAQGETFRKFVTQREVA